MRKITLFLMLLTLFLAACAAQPVKTASATPSPERAAQATSTPTPMSTAIPAPKSITILTLTPTTQATASATLEEECISLEQKLPDDLPLSGVWVMREDSPYLENLADHTHYDVPLKGGGLLSTYDGDMAISPDGTHLAYIDKYYNANNLLEKRILRVIRSSGHSLDMSYWSPDWQWIIGWVDNQNIALTATKGDVVVLNPITGSWRKFQPPNELTPDNYKYYSNIPMYNPTMEWILSHPDYKNTILKDVQTGKTIWQSNEVGQYDDFSWAAKNKTLAVRSGTSIIVVNDSQPEERLDTDDFRYDNFSNLKLSPDGRRLAFNAYINSNDQPAIWDMVQHKLARLCADGYETWGKANWSPDNRFFVQEIYSNNYPYSESCDVLIDTQQMRAYRLPSGYYQHRITWLAQP